MAYDIFQAIMATNQRATKQPSPPLTPSRRVFKINDCNEPKHETRDFFWLADMRNKNLIYPAKFQRPAKWDERDGREWIESILTGTPITALHIRENEDADSARRAYEVFEGQNRSNAARDFLNNKFGIRLNKIGGWRRGGLHGRSIDFTRTEIRTKTFFKDLPARVSDALKGKQIPFTIYPQSTSDDHCRKIFFNMSKGKKINTADKLHAMTNIPLVEDILNPMEEYFRARVELYPKWTVTRTLTLYIPYIQMVAMIFNDYLHLCDTSESTIITYLNTLEDRRFTEIERDIIMSVTKRSLDVLDYLAELDGDRAFAKPVFIDIAWAVFTLNIDVNSDDPDHAKDRHVFKELSRRLNINSDMKDRWKGRGSSHGGSLHSIESHEMRRHFLNDCARQTINKHVDLSATQFLRRRQQQPDVEDDSSEDFDEPVTVIINAPAPDNIQSANIAARRLREYINNANNGQIAKFPPKMRDPTDDGESDDYDSDYGPPAKRQRI